MNRSAILVDRLIGTLRSNSGGTFYLNGLPRTGKTFILRQMIKQLESTDIPFIELGPYRWNGTDVNSLVGNICADLVATGYLDQSTVQPDEFDFATFWEWAITEIRSTNRVFLVTIDVGNSGRYDPQIVASLFSNARMLESHIPDSNIRIYTIFEGFWNTYLLDRYYKEIGISFPYTPTYNYAEWLGIDEDQTIRLVTEQRINAKPIIGKILHEITGGNPSFVFGILDTVGEQKLNFNSIVKATRRYVVDGSMTFEMVDIWMKLPHEAKEILKKIILTRRIRGSIPTEFKQLLHCFGLIKKEYINDQEYLSLRSWYVELALIAHRIRLNISDPVIDRINITELVPEITVINSEAYQVICDIENQVRNFSIQQRYRFASQRVDSDILDIDITVRGNKSDNLAREVEKWRSRCERNGVMVDINPRISYSTTGQLCGLLMSIASELNSNEWLEVASALDEMKDIRDAVMHNQIINDIHLERLYELHARIYKALGDA